MSNVLPSAQFVRSTLDDWQYRRLGEAVNDYSIYMIDRAGVVISWNAGAQRLKGYAAEEVVGRNFSLFYSPEDQVRGEPQHALDFAASNGRFEGEGWRIRKGGSSFCASIMLEPMREDGRIIGFANVTRDISERKDAENTLGQTISALNQAQKMEAFGQLTGGLAHDFNNVLAAVLGSLELLRKYLPNEPKVERLLENAVQGARRGTALTHRMLAFARRQDLAPEAIHLPSLVRGMITLLEPALGSKVALETRFPSRHNSIFADANQLEMAVLNLAVNARDAMPDGGVVVLAVREERLASGQVPCLRAGAYTCLSVQDSGTGMDPATLSRAMEPFYTTKGPGRGTGLGLSMVHGLAIEAGGGLVLTSEVGKGSLAELWLPLIESGLELAKSDRVVLGAVCEPRRAIVLAVDDDSLVLFNTVAMLENLGHKVFEASSSKQALEVLAKEPSIDLVVTDLGMRHLGGRLLSEVTQLQFPALKFLLVTGYAEASLQDYPALPRLTKPFSLDDLAKAIQLALDAGDGLH